MTTSKYGIIETAVPFVEDSKQIRKESTQVGVLNSELNKARPFLSAPNVKFDRLKENVMDDNAIVGRPRSNMHKICAAVLFSESRSRTVEVEAVRLIEQCSNLSIHVALYDLVFLSVHLVSAQVRLFLSITIVVNVIL